jgi:hypothetical protein
MVFANVFNVWTDNRYLESGISFYIQSVVICCFVWKRKPSCIYICSSEREKYLNSLCSLLWVFWRDIVIQQKCIYSIYISSSWYRAYKILVTSWSVKVRDASFLIYSKSLSTRLEFMLMRSSWDPLDSFRMGAGCQGKWILQLHSLITMEGRGTGDGAHLQWPIIASILPA